MKSFRLLAFASLALLATARADLTIVQTVAGAEGLNRITMKVKGDKARVEVSPQITTIIDGKTGALTNLLNDRKMVMRIDGAKAKAMAEMAKSFVQEEAPSQAPPKPTGKKEKINGHDTQEFVTDSPKYKASYWVATTYPDYKNILQQMSVLQNGAFASITKGMPDYRALPGLPLRTTVTIPGQPEITSTIESISQAPLADSEFIAPASYTEMKMPDFLGGEQPPSQP